MKTKKQLWLLAGGNGAGKSIFYSTQLQPLGMPFVNAVFLAKQLYPDAPEQHSYEAAKITETMRMRLLAEGRTFCFETVFSHPSKIDFVAQAKALDYEIVLVFIHLEFAALNHARIAQRVSEGGHNVPEQKSKAVFHVHCKISSRLYLCVTMPVFWITQVQKIPFNRLQYYEKENCLRKLKCCPSGRGNY